MSSNFTNLTQLTERLAKCILSIIKEIDVVELHAATFNSETVRLLFFRTKRTKMDSADVSPRGGDAGFIKVLDAKNHRLCRFLSNNLWTVC